MSHDTPQVRRVGIIGGGVIGAAWAARFVLNGSDAVIYDPDPNVTRAAREVLDNARRAHQRLHGAALPPEGQLLFADTLAGALDGVDFVQENLPEREDLKQRVFAEADALLPPHVIIGSSTSGLLPTKLQAAMRHPERLVVGHPFNPVYLLPLVEVCGGAQTSAATITRAAAIYQALGMRPLHVRHEIDGFIADRLLEAVWREALWLINDGIATAGEIDDAIRFGAGMRWSFMGTFLTYRLAGGEAGMRHFLHQFGPSMKWPWTKLIGPELTDELIETITEQSDAQAGGVDLRTYERLRDDCLVDLILGLERNDFASGQVARLHRERLLLAASERGEALASDIGVTDLDGRIVTRRTAVEHAWIDYNNHLTEWAYLKLFGEATDTVLGTIGADLAYVESGYSYYTVETHLRHLGQARLGERVEVVTRVLGADAKRLHLFHAMTNQTTGALIATAEHIALHVDTAAEKASPAPPEMAARAAVLAAAQAHLPLPDGAGRAVRGPA